MVFVVILLVSSALGAAVLRLAGPQTFQRFVFVVAQE